MDDLTLALTLAGKTKTIEEKSEQVTPSSASVLYMVAVTASSGGKVVLKDEIESAAEWADGDFVEIDEDGNFEEYESEDDPLEDIDDAAVDRTDGDGVDIEEADVESVSFSVSEYHTQAQEAYVMEIAEEGEAVEDALPDENASITDEIDDGDATELPEGGETSSEDALADENATIEDLTDDDYTLVDSESDDVSEDYVAGAETSDGYTTASCIGAIKEGDRVAVIVQDGKLTVIGVVGSGDEQNALLKDTSQTANDASDAADEAGALADSAQKKADEAEKAADEAAGAAIDAQLNANEAKQKAEEAQQLANNAAAEAEEAAQKAADAEAKADQVELDLSGVTAEVSNVKKDAAQMRTDLMGEIDVVRTEASETYAKKTDVATTETTLRKEIEDSIAETKTTFAQDYAKKTELEGAIVDAKADLQTQITQNANEISSVAKSVEETQVDITDQNGKIANAVQIANAAQTVANGAKTDADEAKAQAEEAQAAADAANTAAATAQSNADKANTQANLAQSLADSAKTDLAKAQTKLAEVENTVGSTQADLEEAQQAVSEAQQAVDEAQAAADEARAQADAAQATANEAKTSAFSANAAASTAQQKADEAQTSANNAQKAADEAKEDLRVLENRVTTAETKIQQNSEQIALMATKKEVQETLEGYYTIEETEAAIKVKSDAITSSVKSTYATKEEIKNIEVGGRNLAIGTKSEWQEVSVGSSNGQLPHTANGTVSHIHTYTDYGVKVGDFVTFGVDLNANGKPIAIGAYLANSAGAIKSAHGNYINSGETGRSTLAVEALEGYDRFYVCIETDGSVSQSLIQRYKCLKIEKGNKATDWTPAPEDMATGDEVDNAQASADEANAGVSETNERVSVAESLIQQLSDSISMLVVDEKGQSLMTQNSDGVTYSFSMSETNNTVNDLQQKLDTLQQETGSTQSTVDALNQAVDDIGKTMDYVRIGTYEDEPCIELGESDSDYTLMITNKRILFRVGSNIPTLVDTSGLVTENISINGELRHGNYFWKQRGNGHYSLQWKAVKG